MPVAALRPRSATEIVDASFQLLRRHYTQLAAVATVALLPYMILVAITRETGMGARPTFLLLISQWLCGSLAEAAVVLGASDAYLKGDADIARSLAGTARRVPAVLVAGVLRGFMVVLAALAFLFPGMYVLLRTFAVIPVVVLEGRAADHALLRSWHLARGEVWKIFSTMMLGWLIFLMLYLLLVFLAGWVVGLVAASNARLTSLVVAILLALVYPITGIVTTLLYYDIRVRREGFDLELLALEVEPPPSA